MTDVNLIHVLTGLEDAHIQTLSTVSMDADEAIYNLEALHALTEAVDDLTTTYSLKGN